MKTKQEKTESAGGNVNDFPPRHYSFPGQRRKKCVPHIKKYDKKKLRDNISRIRPRQFC